MQIIYVPLRGYMCHTSAILRKQKLKARKSLTLVLAFAILAKLRLSAWELFEVNASLLPFSPQCEKRALLYLRLLRHRKPKTQAVAAPNDRKPKSQSPLHHGTLLAIGEKFVALEYSPFGGLIRFKDEIAPVGVGTL